MPLPTVFRSPRLALALAVAVLGPMSVVVTEAAEIRVVVRSQAAKPLRFGIVTSSRPDATADRAEPFRQRLADTLGVEVRTLRFPTERALIEAFADGRVDYAPFSASGYAMAWRLCGCLEPLGVARAADNTAGWRAVVVVRTGAAFDKPAALADKRLAVSGESSIGGRRLPLRLLEGEGLRGGTMPKLETFDGPRAAVNALLSDRADAAIAWSTLEGDLVEGYGRGTLHDMVAAGELNMADVRVLWASPILPHGPHAARRDLAEGTKRRLRDMLVDLDEVDPDAYDAVEPVLTGGFLRIGHAAYAPFIDLVTPRAALPEAPDATGTTAPPG